MLIPLGYAGYTELDILLYLLASILAVLWITMFIAWIRNDRGLFGLFMFVFLFPIAGLWYFLKRLFIHSIKKDLRKEGDKILKKKVVNIKHTFTYIYDPAAHKELEAHYKRAMAHHAYRTGGLWTAAWFLIFSKIFDLFKKDKNKDEVRTEQRMEKIRGFIILTDKRLIFAQNDHGKPSKILYDSCAQDSNLIRTGDKILVAEYESGKYEVNIRNPEKWIPQPLDE